ncbi:Protein of unknown function [Bacillus cytotoxicus]|nr:Protein of unknown function [Bacillus cytotoxicus]
MEDIKICNRKTSQNIFIHYMSKETTSLSPFTLSQEQLWYLPQNEKWSIGEHFYHLYLIARMLKIAIQFSFTLIPYAKLRRNTPFATEIHDIYAEYNEKHGKGMKVLGF